jgi:hypothetical protein
VAVKLALFMLAAVFLLNEAAVIAGEASPVLLPIGVDEREPD